MPIVNLPSIPTAPAVGQSSSAVSRGYIDPEADPYLGRGGRIARRSGALNIAGEARIGRYLYLKPGQEKITEQVRQDRILQTIEGYKAQGFKQVSTYTLQRGSDRISINPKTGEVSSTSNLPSQSASRSYISYPQSNNYDIINTVNRLQRQVNTQAYQIANPGYWAVSKEGGVLSIAGGQSAYNQSLLKVGGGIKEVSPFVNPKTFQLVPAVNVVKNISGSSGRSSSSGGSSFSSIVKSSTPSSSQTKINQIIPTVTSNTVTLPRMSETKAYSASPWK